MWACQRVDMDHEYYNFSDTSVPLSYEVQTQTSTELDQHRLDTTHNSLAIMHVHLQRPTWPAQNTRFIIVNETIKNRIVMTPPVRTKSMTL